MTITRIEQKIVACSDLFRIDGTDITVSVVDFSDPIVMLESKTFTDEGGWGFDADATREWIAPLRAHRGGVIPLSSSVYGAHVELDLTAAVAHDLADALDEALAQVPVYPDWLEMDRLMDEAEAGDSGAIIAPEPADPDGFGLISGISGGAPILGTSLDDMYEVTPTELVEASRAVIHARALGVATVRITDPSMTVRADEGAEERLRVVCELLGLDPRTGEGL